MQWTQSSLNSHNSVYYLRLHSSYNSRTYTAQADQPFPFLAAFLWSRLPWYTRHPVPLDVVHTPCSVLRPLPAKTRRDSILPAPLILTCRFWTLRPPRFPILPTSPSVVRIPFLFISHTPHQFLGGSYFNHLTFPFSFISFFLKPLDSFLLSFLDATRSRCHTQSI